MLAAISIDEREIKKMKGTAPVRFKSFRLLLLAILFDGCETSNKIAELIMNEGEFGLTEFRIVRDDQWKFHGGI